MPTSTNRTLGRIQQTIGAEIVGLTHGTIGADIVIADTRITPARAAEPRVGAYAAGFIRIENGRITHSVSVAHLLLQDQSTITITNHSIERTERDLPERHMSWRSTNNWP